MTRILLVEDDEIMRITVQDRLIKEGWNVDTAVNGREALDLVRKNNFHLILSDIRMPGMDGRELLREVKAETPNTDMFMMTAYGSVDDAITCLKNGASDYIIKPFDMDDLVIRISRIFEMQQVKARCDSLESCCRQAHPQIIGRSKAIERVFQLINQAGPTDSTVLITGESGTGKELAATALHQASPRARRPYIRVNCAAIPEGLIESELFGHEKGAFTGAHTRHRGRFEMADGGTILLDEIGDMPLSLQAKLLRILQEGECERVGGTQTIHLDVRVICATAKDLQAEVRAGRFRQDLLYRISVIPLVMPPLRKRKEDIPLLVDHFLQEFSTKRGLLLTLSTEAMQMLLDYDFPGNVRELKNIIERASVLAPGPVIEAGDLAMDLAAAVEGETESDQPLPLCKALADTEKQCILKALNSTGGNRTRAAELLGISRKNLWEKMKQHQIELT